MAEALKEAYGDIFLIKAKPSASDKKAIEGKFKSFHNVSDNVSELMAKTFIALLEMADINSQDGTHTQEIAKEVDSQNSDKHDDLPRGKANRLSGLHYNIQIHLPATKDVEVYNAIFKSLRGHLLEE